jgi:hypothetical protein
MSMRRRQQGMIEIALLGLLLFFVCAHVSLQFLQTLRRSRDYQSQANSIAVVQSAAQSYAESNKAAFQSGKTVMFLNDQYAPSIDDLERLGYLGATAGTNLINPFGSSYGISLKLESNQSITGVVYLTGSILTTDGKPDQQRACGIAQALGDAGVCTAPNNAAFLQNGTTALPIPNPSGQPAVVGALIFVAP